MAITSANARTTLVEGKKAEPRAERKQARPEPAQQQKVSWSAGAQPPAKDSFLDRALLRPAASMAAGVYASTAATLRTADQWLQFLEEKTSLPTGKLLDDAVANQRAWSDFFAERGFDPSAGGNAALLHWINFNLGQALMEAPLLAKNGCLALYGAATAGGDAIEAKEAVLPATALGFVYGSLLAGIFKRAALISPGAPLTMGGLIYGGQSLLHELTRPPEDRDFDKVRADLIVGAGLASIAFPFGPGTTATALLKDAFGRVPRLSHPALKALARSTSVANEEPASEKQTGK